MTTSVRFSIYDMFLVIHNYVFTVIAQKCNAIFCQKQITHYENTPMEYTDNFFSNFIGKILIILICLIKMDCG